MDTNVHLKGEGEKETALVGGVQEVEGIVGDRPTRGMTLEIFLDNLKIEIDFPGIRQRTTSGGLDFRRNRC